jgi:phage recombination protein Bet
MRVRRRAEIEDMASKSVANKPAEPAHQPAAVAATLPNGKASLVLRMAAKYQVDSDKMMSTLKATAFRGDGNKEVTNEQMMSLLVVANEYNLNPWLKEIYAFPDKSGGIVPVIGVDGWIRMMNTHPQYQAQEFQYPDHEDDEIPAWIQCVIWRKDREKPTVIREYFSEVKRDTGPWRSHPRRMLRHKTLIQCARVAFGFSGVYDPDEAERIRDAIDVTPRPTSKPETEAPKAISNGQPAPANAEQLTLIRERLSDAEIPVTDACGEFGLDQLEGLQFDQVPEMLAWITERGK